MVIFFAAPRNSSSRGQEPKTNMHVEKEGVARETSPQLEYLLKGSSVRIPYKIHVNVILVEEQLMDVEKPSVVEGYRKRLETALSYGEVWDIVRDTVEFALNKRRRGMMLFLDDMPIQLGAYHPVGTNNIVLNRVLVQIVEASVESKRVVNALIYNLLVHEYLHALGELSEVAVRNSVVEVSRKCFGEDYIATQVAVKSPWSLLKGIPLEGVNVPKRFMEIVKDFEKTDRYVV